MKKHNGFTIVELIIIITVIAILASIVVVSYNFARDDAMDAKIKSAVKTAGDAISLHESQVPGGRISGTGLFNVANGVDTLVPTYLKPGYRDGLTSANAADTNNVMRWYACDAVDGGFIVYASLTNPTDEDTSSFTSKRTACGHSNTQAPTTGTSRYNYAQIF